jgi:maleate cis-trans isomerase
MSRVGDRTANRRPRDVGAWLEDEAPAQGVRIGVINPSAAVTFDHEWVRMLPRGVSFHVTRLLLVDGSATALAAMAARAAEAAGILATSRVHVVAYACTLGSLFRGVQGERALAAELTRAAGGPAVTMARAAVEALRALGVRRVAVGNPYGMEANRWVRQYLEDEGFTVAALRGTAVADSWSIAQAPPRAAFDLGREVLAEAPDADGIFLSCGNMRTVEVLDELEELTGRPVVSSNQAMLWYSLRILGVEAPVTGYGRLLKSVTPRPGGNL